MKLLLQENQSDYLLNQLEGKQSSVVGDNEQRIKSPLVITWDEKEYDINDFFAYVKKEKISNIKSGTLLAYLVSKDE